MTLTLQPCVARRPASMASCRSAPPDTKELITKRIRRGKLRLMCPLRAPGCALVRIALRDGRRSIVLSCVKFACRHGIDEFQPSAVNALRRKFAGHLGRLSSKPGAKARIQAEKPHLTGECGNIPRANEMTVHAMLNEFTRTALAIEADAWRSHLHGFQKRVGKSLETRRQHKHVGTLQPRSDVADVAGKRYGSGQSQRVRQPLQGLSLRALSENCERPSQLCQSRSVEGPEKQIEALLFGQSADAKNKRPWNGLRLRARGGLNVTVETRCIRNHDGPLDAREAPEPVRAVFRLYGHGGGQRVGHSPRICQDGLSRLWPGCTRSDTITGTRLPSKHRTTRTLVWSTKLTTTSGSQRQYLSPHVEQSAQTPCALFRLWKVGCVVYRCARGERRPGCRNRPAHRRSTSTASHAARDRGNTGSDRRRRVRRRLPQARI